VAASRSLPRDGLARGESPSSKTRRDGIPKVQDSRDQEQGSESLFFNASRFREVWVELAHRVLPSRHAVPLPFALKRDGI